MAQLRSTEPTPQTRTSPRASRKARTQPTRTSHRNEGQQSKTPTPNVTPRKSQRTRKMEVQGADEGVKINTPQSKSRPRKSPTKKKQALAVVDEDEAEGAEVSEREADRHDEENVSNLRHASVVSGVSNLTSLSQSRIQDLKDQVPILIETLTDIHPSAVGILKLLVPKELVRKSIEDAEPTVAEIANKLQQPGSYYAALLGKRERPLNESMEGFGEDHFIQPEYFVRAIKDPGSGVDVPDGLWRPDEIIYLANLARLSINIMSRLDKGEDALLALQNLDSTFPKPFLAKLDGSNPTTGQTYSDGSDLKVETFNAAIAIRTQLAVLQLRQRSEDQNTFDPDIVLRDIFFESQVESISMLSEENAGAILKRWEYGQFLDRSGQLHQSFEAEIVGRIREIRQFFAEADSVFAPGSNIDLDGLEQKFPVAQFQTEMAKWIRIRTTELEKKIADKGGPETIQAACEEMMSSAKSAQQTQAQTRLTGATGLMLSIAKRHSGGQTQNIQVQDHAQGPDIDDTDSHPAGTHAATNGDTRGIAPKRGRGRPAGAGAPKRRVVDAQPGAKKVIWSDELDGTQERDLESNVLVVEPEPNQGRNRQPASPAPQATQDVGFEQDDRQRNANGRREKSRALRAEKRDTMKRKEVEGSAEQSPAKRARRGDQTSEDVMEDDEEQEEERQPTTGKGNVGSPEGSSYRPDASDAEGNNESPSPNERPATAYPGISQKAKIVVAQQAREAPPQRRKAWSPEETSALISYINKFGSRWSFIKTVDDGEGQGSRILSLRSQGDLKDKAKNIKMDYLKAQERLPKRFDEVMLDAKYRRVLEHMGIDYEQVQVRAPGMHRIASKA